MAEDFPELAQAMASCRQVRPAVIIRLGGWLCQKRGG